jgi:hypothetical protein
MMKIALDLINLMKSHLSILNKRARLNPKDKMEKTKKEKISIFLDTLSKEKLKIRKQN